MMYTQICNIFSSAYSMMGAWGDGSRSSNRGKRRFAVAKRGSKTVHARDHGALCHPHQECKYPKHREVSKATHCTPSSTATGTCLAEGRWGPWDLAVKNSQSFCAASAHDQYKKIQIVTLQ
eukprot:3021150-Rhodomonas_salina.2